MSEWRETTLGNVLTLQRGFDLPARDRIDGPYPIVSSSGITGYHAVAKVEPPGVVIGRYGSLGSVHWLTEPYWPHNTALWVKDFKGNDPRFTSYLLRTISHDGSAAAAVPGVNRNHLHALPVRLPDIAAQARIAAVLAAFDELIEINERRIELLEDLARSLYREWFVRFRFPDHGRAGPVDAPPNGWVRATLAGVTSQLSRGIAPKYAEDGAWTIVNQRCIRNSRVSLVSARRHGRTVVEAKQLRRYDVLVNSTGVGTLGRAAIVLDDLERATADSHVTIVRARDPEMQLWLGMLLLEHQSELAKMGAGSTGQTELSRDRLGAIPLTVPPGELLTRFSESTMPVLEAAKHLGSQNERLASTRDLLLPRLVTGQLDIADLDIAELLAEEAAG